MIKIITKITQEMNNGIRLRKKPRDICLKRLKLDTSQKSLAEISFEKIRSEESLTDEKSVPEINERNRKIEDSTVRDLKLEESRRKDVENKKEEDTAEGKRESEKFAVKGSNSSIEQVFERDTCFFAIPCIVTFEVNIVT
ncbi:hypothetical protein K0M31_006593 [Melipona bicolor]|uniref:Uncharacterized protein n=1 Tax=Melipona bicolor TaxID=60889 RepID=A0AA40KL73_9HYME|nr:hypothetical protein K0M31_006593 [Melipona bicolor]